jgi:hypothetical protein
MPEVAANKWWSEAMRPDLASVGAIADANVAMRLIAEESGDIKRTAWPNT